MTYNEQWWRFHVATHQFNHFVCTGRVSSVTDAEDVSYVSSPYLPDILRHGMPHSAYHDVTCLQSLMPCECGVTLNACTDHHAFSHQGCKPLLMCSLGLALGCGRPVQPLLMC